MCVKTQCVNITLPYDLILDMDMNIPTGRRSEFIAKAVSEKLGRKRNINEELKKSLQANKKFDKKVAKDWSAIETEQ